jgi:CheY-like chemotaxis protein
MSSLAVVGSAPVAVQQPARILLVDDNDANLLALEAVLESAGLELVTARSGQEALRQHLSAEYAVILLDVLMPDMDGFETARRIRERERGRATPIIFVTAYRELEEQLLRGYSAGAVDFLYKPIEPDVLRFKVSVFLDLYRQQAVIAQYAAKLEQANAELEQRVKERTADLSPPMRNCNSWPILPPTI